LLSQSSTPANARARPAMIGNVRPFETMREERPKVKFTADLSNLEVRLIRALLSSCNSRKFA